MAGRKPGTPKTGGRQKGTPNKATPVKEAAAAYTEEAIATLAEIMVDKSKPAAARAMAANSLLDRAHGKPQQTVQMDATVRQLTDMDDAELAAIASGSSYRASGAPEVTH